MRLYWFAVLALAFPLCAQAAPLPVQTGEHASFSRVVIAVTPDTAWALGRDDAGYVLRLDTDDGFDLRQFYDLIPRDRIADISQDVREGELRLRVDCRCHAQAELYRGRFLVLDVRDGEAPENSPFETAFPSEPIAAVDNTTAEIAQEAIGLKPPPFRRAINPVLPIITPRVSGQTEREMQQPTPQAIPATSIVEPPSELEPATDTAIAMIAQSLGESLGRALSEGLLEEDVQAMRDATADGAQNQRETGLRPEDFPGIDARSSIDPMAVAALADQPETQSGQACLSPELFDVSSWGDDSPPHVQLRLARLQVSDAADQVVSDAALALARLYVFLGFGREAEQVLDLDGAQSRARIMVRQIARMIDEEPAAADLFIGQVSCPHAVALWAFLAQPNGPTDAQVDRRAVVTAFRALPTYVQRPIAPRLTEAFLRIGAEDEALQILGRGSAEERADLPFVLAEAAVSDALGEDAVAINMIVDAIRKEARPTPAAMVRFFEEGIANGIIFTDSDFLTADALRFEFMGTSDGKALADAQFAALLSGDRFDAARALLAEREEAALAQDAALFTQAALRLPDAEFLRFVWNADLRGIGAETQNTVAERFLDLGFPDQAMAIMTDTALPNEAAQQAALRARAQLAQQQEALVSVADPAISTDEISRAAIQAAPLGNADLRNSRALVDDAVRTRDSIRALLEATPTPDAF